MRYKAIYISVITAMMSSIPVHAEQQNNSEQNSAQANTPDFSLIDRNRSNFLEMQEAQFVISDFNQFKQLDENRDGRLSQEEYAGYTAEQDGSASSRNASSQSNESSSTDNKRKTPELAGDQHSNEKHTGSNQTSGGEVHAESSQSKQKMDTQQKRPQVNVSQSSANIKVQQAKPEVAVTQSRPQVDVKQQASVVNVKQPDPEIIVKQKEPVVSVQQSEPVVNVTQKKPQVNVKQEKPNVQIEQQQPEVTISQSEPDVQVHQAQPQVNVTQGEPRVIVERQIQTSSEDSGDSQQDKAATSDRISNANKNDLNKSDQKSSRRTAVAEMQEMEGKRILNAEGKKIGEIEKLVLRNSDNKPFVVIDSRNFLKLGSDKSVLPLDKLSINQRKNAVRAELSGEQIEIERMPYVEKEYGDLSSSDKEHG